MPDWRVELNEKVRAIKARRSMEAMVGEASTAKQAALAPVPSPAEPAPEPEEEPGNPIVAAALNRLRLASEQAARYSTRSNVSHRSGQSPAVAHAALLSPQLDPIYNEDMPRRAPLTAVSPADAASAPVLKSTAPPVQIEPTLFDPVELLDELGDEPEFLARLETRELPTHVSTALPVAPVRPAPMLSRLAGGFIDTAVLGVVSLPFLGVVLLVEGDFQRTSVLILLGATLAILSAFYLFAMLSVGGKTIGMMFGHTRVTDADGHAPEPRSLLLRVVGYALCVITLGGGFGWSFIDPEGRGLHDILSRTRVVED